jgi:hypothetical protein
VQQCSVRSAIVVATEFASFCINLQKLHCDTFEIHKNAFRDDAMSRTTAFERHLCLKCGQASVGDFERSGRPLSSRDDDKTAAVH